MLPLKHPFTSNVLMDAVYEVCNFSACHGVI